MFHLPSLSNSIKFTKEHFFYDDLLRIKFLTNALDQEDQSSKLYVRLNVDD